MQLDYNSFFYLIVYNRDGEGMKSGGRGTISKKIFTLVRPLSFFKRIFENFTLVPPTIIKSKKLWGGVYKFYWD